MVANLEVLSKEMIKPSSPTPHHLQNHKLSFLDQIAPPIYIPLIFFYQANQLDTFNRAQISQLLKESLSNILAQFYPLAGKICDQNLSIECNDAGALFVEAQVHSNLLQVIGKPVMEELKQYLPPCSFSEVKTILLAIQINFFDCGGLAIGVQISHKIADGTALATFVNAWAKICRGVPEFEPFNFELASLFPSCDMSSFGFKPTTGMTKEKIVTERFIFDKEKLASLKQASASSLVKNPTRVEAVSAYFWRHFIDASKSKTVAAVHAVNMRPRMNPALTDHTFGNVWTHIVAVPTTEKGHEGYEHLVGDLRNAIRTIDSNYVKKVQNGYEYMKNVKKTMELASKGDVELCNFSSWCRFPVYEVDFGWGKPTWVSTTSFPFKNIVILMSTSCGEGIEAWVNMVEEDVPSFQSELMKLSVDLTKDFST